MTIREQSEAMEYQLLSPYACKSAQTAGRDFPLEKCPIRTEFQRDRDRVIHCKAFRRLMHKTQVFLSPRGDHYRTRLTHSLEVSQIARTMARALRLNEDLTEAIALGHDLGHAPFGHAGEQALNEAAPFGFAHFSHSVRVVERLERDGAGLNLTREVRNGILCHTRGRWADTLEGRVVRYADKFAYLNHDIEDAVRAGVLTERDLPWKVQYLLGRSNSQRISSLVDGVIRASLQKDGAEILLDPALQEAYQELLDFMTEAVYTNPAAKGEEAKARELLRRLYGYFSQHPKRLPEEYGRIVREEGPERAACDYIAGMSDRYAVELYEELFVPKSWETR